MIERRFPGRRVLLSATSVIAALVAVGCVAAPGSSGIPTGSGGSSAGPSMSPTASPTASQAASPSPAPSTSTTPTSSPSASPAPSQSATGCGVATWAAGADDLVLRVTVAGGFVPPGVDQTNVPVISIYGGGRVISPGAQIMIYPGPLLPALQVQQLTPDGMRKLLDAAAAAGLLVPDVTYESHGIADAPTTFFTLIADGCTHHVNAYALSEGVSTTDLDQKTIDARAALLAFRNALSDLPTLVGAANITDTGLYAATSYRVITREEPAGTGATGSPAAAVKWPLTTSLATFGEPLAPGMEDRCGVVDGADATTMTPLFQKANAETHWTSGGKTYSLRVRPLLPDESGCADPLV